jgi:hypothetical protein
MHAHARTLMTLSQVSIIKAITLSGQEETFLRKKTPCKVISLRHND